ncbi:hypothetical protein SAMN04487890_107149 [Mucilaginibacter polytrichastri]|nr:hypothetical protein SAMN04487890_107149 [Mucilaginibacter polytrichastri]
MCFICLGCAKKSAQPHLKVSVLNANTINFGNIDYNTLANLHQDSLNTAEWQAILPVYRMPADTDMKDFVLPQPGKYAFKNNQLIFSADTPFLGHSLYFARYYRLHDESNAWDVMKGKWKRGTPQYVECTFTP